MNNALFFESTGDERSTPDAFFKALDAEFHFTLDAAASALNHKCDIWFGDGGIAYDALLEDWGGEGSVVWLNPPYSVAGAFVSKAAEEAAKGATVVLLLPARTDTKWWHRWVWSKDHHTWREGVEGRLLAGRLSFELKVSPEMRALIKQEFQSLQKLGIDLTDTVASSKTKELIELTGLPKMAIEGILDDLPDEDLLSSAPFPSAVIVFRGRSEQ